MQFNKSQGLSLAKVSIYLRDPVFTHGQFCVALSIVSSRDGVKLLILDKQGKVANITTNIILRKTSVVYKFYIFMFELYF